MDRLAESVAQPLDQDFCNGSSDPAAAPPAILLCGDFNAEPDSAELQVDILAQRSVCLQHMSLRETSDSDTEADTTDPDANSHSGL